MIEISQVQIPAGAAAELFSPGSIFCADSYCGIRSIPTLLQLRIKEPGHTIQHNTTLLSLCREICFLPHHLHKTSTQWDTELKTAQIQGKYLKITMYTPTHPHTFFWLTNNLKHSINYNKTKFLKQQNTKIQTLNRTQHINYRQHLWSNILNPGTHTGTHTYSHTHYSSGSPITENVQ